MKTRFDNSQLAHVWAQQSQPSGSGSSFFFDGASIYSYGRHFEIARFITRNGARAVLFTTRGYSVTTQRHISLARRAIPSGVPVFHVPDIDAAARGHLNDATRDYYRQEVASIERSAVKRRRAESAAIDLRRAQEVAREASAYAEFMGRRWRIKEPLWTPERMDALRATLAKEAKRNKARKDAAARRYAAEQARARDEWRAGSGNQYPGGAVMLRLSTDRSEIQTSMGAHIPASLARMVWDLVTGIRCSGQAHTFTGDWNAKPRLGQFTLDAVHADGSIRAGCHEIGFDELQRMAVALGFVS